LRDFGLFFRRGREKTQQRNVVNNRSSGITGKMLNYYQDGLGAVTRRMVRERAEEIALLRGRRRVTREDRLQARKELLEARGRRDDRDPLEEGLESLDPSELRTEAGHQAPNSPTDDEELVQRRLAERGVREAGHDQMVAGYRSGRDEEREEREEEEAEDQRRKNKKEALDED